MKNDVCWVYPYEDFLKNKNGQLDSAFSELKKAMEKMILEFANVGILN